MFCMQKIISRTSPPIYYTNHLMREKIDGVKRFMIAVGEVQCRYMGRNILAESRRNTAGVKIIDGGLWLNEGDIVYW